MCLPDLLIYKELEEPLVVMNRHAPRVATDAPQEIGSRTAQDRVSYAHAQEAGHACDP